MAVQKNRKSRSKRDKRRTHDRMRVAAVSTDGTTGEAHRRHHVTRDGFYRGRQVVETDDES